MATSDHYLKNLTIEKGWLVEAQHVRSPNFNQRPDNTEIDLLVVHNISLPPEQFGGGYIEQFFCNELDCSVHPYFKTIDGLEVSSHLLITREGEVIQFVPFYERAWHAGQSCFKGQDNCNDFSIGIELEGADTILYTSEQYLVLSSVTRALQKGFPKITNDRIVGHSDISPGRKTDPGPAFDWSYFKELLNRG